MLALPLALLAGCDKPVPVGMNTKPPVSVSVHHVLRQASLPAITVTGEALNSSVVIRSNVTAVVKQVHFTAGQSAKKGEVLFEFDDAPLRAALAISDAQVKVTRAAYKEAIRGAARTHAMVQKGAATALESEQALALVASSKDQYQAALAGRRGDLFAVHQAKIVAPMDGILGTSTVKAGDLVTAQGETLVVITQPYQQSVEFSLSQDQFSLLQLRKTASMGLTATFTDGSVAGLSAIEPLHAIDRTQPAVVVRALLLAPSAGFIPGDEVQIEAKVSAEHFVTVPTAALRENSDGHYVFVVAGSKVDVRQVTAFHWNDATWLVDQGLSPDDQVITSNFTKIRVGARVEVLEGAVGQVEQSVPAALAPKS
jgi:RND family efflux transporter MFP subunit